MPRQFVEAFGHRVAVIIDYFEIFRENIKSESSNVFFQQEQPYNEIFDWYYA